MPSATAASIAAAISADVAVEAEAGGGDGQRLVVAEVGGRRDAGEREHAVRSVVVAGCDPGDVRCVEGPVERRVERSRRVPIRRLGRSEGLLHDHLRRRGLRLAFRESCGIRQPLWIEERMIRVDAVVDHPDLHAVPCGRERRPPELVGADHLRPLVEQLASRDRGAANRERVVGHVGPDLGDPGNVRQELDVRGRHDEREAVGDDPVAPAHPGRRDRRNDVVLGSSLCRLELPDVVPVRRRGERPAKGCQRWCVQGYDHLGHRHRRSCQPAAGDRCGRQGRDRKEDDPSQSADERT